MFRVDSRKNYRYAVYEHKLITNDGLVHVRSFIVLKNKYGVIVRFTKLHRFVETYRNKFVKPLASDNNAQLYYVCMMLNYILIDNYEVYGIDHVFLVTKDMLNAFFTDYALNPKSNGAHRSKQSVENCISSIAAFFSCLIEKYGNYVTVRKKELYRNIIGCDYNHKPMAKIIPNFNIRYVPEESEIFRDIPTKIFKILMNLSMRYTPDIAFAMGLQAFAGLRPGEVCNVRQEIAPKGSGIIFTYSGDKLKKVEIDLTHEYAMRSDGVECGKIKKERKQCVYPAFLDVFQQLYNNHKIYLSTRFFEKEYCPMFINSCGKAMTYGNYYTRFQYLVDACLRPTLLRHSDQECRIFGQILCENKLSPHSLRHWFSVQLTLRGESIEQLQYWRGDKSPESAFLYLQNKGDLINELSKTSDMLANLLMESGIKNYEQN